MKAGAENRRKTITAGALGAVALVCIFFIYNTLFGGTSTPPPSITTNPPAGNAVTNAVRSRGEAEAGATGERAVRKQAAPAGPAAAGVNAQRLARVSGQFDPRLDEAAMLRTESLVYSGSGRNIFSATYEAPAALVLPKNLPPARPTGPVAPPPVVNLGPPPPPPIPLKFFGTVQRIRGEKRVFLLSGEDVYLAGAGEIVARHYKVGRIEANAVQITDLSNSNTQMVPLQR